MSLITFQLVTLLIIFNHCSHRVSSKDPLQLFSLYEQPLVSIYLLRFSPSAISTAFGLMSHQVSCSLSIHLTQHNPRWVQLRSIDFPVRQSKPRNSPSNHPFFYLCHVHYSPAFLFLLCWKQDNYFTRAKFSNTSLRFYQWPNLVGKFPEIST